MHIESDNKYLIIQNYTPERKASDHEFGKGQNKTNGFVIVVKKRHNVDITHHIILSL